MPLYPMLDDRITKSSADNNAPVWGTKENKSAWSIYLGDKVMNNNAPIYAAPARADDLSNLPPAITVIGTADPFYDETIDYFNRLNNAEVKTDLEIYEGGYHAFDMMVPYAKISKDAYSFLLEKLIKYTDNFL